MIRARLLGSAFCLAAVAALTSCVQVPDTGPVVEARQPGQAEPVQQGVNIPPPPRDNADQEEIVSGFLDAMTATPVGSTPASEFLTKRAQLQWQPRRVLTYTHREPSPRASEVVVRLSGVRQVGAAGQWQGRGAPGASTIRFPMAREHGQWRIAAAPDALIVPRDFYDGNFVDASVYYFDPTGRILVPEPVHVPQGLQLASSLVRALLHTPRTGPASVTRSFIPPGLTVDPVPVTQNVAEVNLKGADPDDLDQEVVKRILAQLSWTLRQDPTIQAFRLTIGGRAMTDDSGASRFSVRPDASDPFDPAVSLASPQFYALRKGLLVSGQVTDPTRVPGPFGDKALGIDSFAMSLDSTRVAAVVSDSLVVGRPFQGESEPTTVLTGDGLLRPAWDFAGRLWEIQDGTTGAQVMYIRHGRVHPVRVPGVSGQDVRRFLVSRDGSRLVAVVRKPGADQLLVSRLHYALDGTALGASRALAIPWRVGRTNRIRDIGWTTPTTLAVLDQVSASSAEVRILSVDGSTSPVQAPVVGVGGRVQGLATSPNETPYAVVASGLIDISRDTPQLDPTAQIPTEDLRHVAYAG
jgi:hypothetical protein